MFGSVDGNDCVQALTMMRRRRSAHVSELREMYSTGTKAEIESLYPVDAGGGFDLSEFLIGKILHADYF